MTREEAIECNKNLKMYMKISDKNQPCKFLEENYIALDMAIKALEQEPCEDAIRRADVLDLCDSKDLEYKVTHFKEDVECLPSVYPKPKTGHWIDIIVGDMPAQACDRCNTFYPLAYTGGGHKYCPNCGAKMVEPESED